MKREIPLWTDPWTKKEVSFHVLDEDTYAVDTRYDVEPILEENTAVRNAQPDGWKGREHLVASIPMPIYQALLSAWNLMGLSRDERQAALKRFLMDPDNVKFRTKRGRL